MERCDVDAICRRNPSPSRRTDPIKGGRSSLARWNRVSSADSSSGVTRTTRNREDPRVVPPGVKADLHLLRRIIRAGVAEAGVHPLRTGDERITVGNRKEPATKGETVRKQRESAGSVGRRGTPRPSVRSGATWIFNALC